MEHVIEIFGNAVGRQTLSVNGVVQFTASNFLNLSTGSGAASTARVDARAALLTVDGVAATNDIRWTVDGTDPVEGTTGHVLQGGKGLFIRGLSNLKRFKAIKQGTATTVQVTFFL